MACPHVAGLIAYFISAEKNISPEEMSKKLQRLAKRNVLTGIREYQSDIPIHRFGILKFCLARNSGTPNLLAQNH
jgi:hypothetical protein